MLRWVHEKIRRSVSYRHEQIYKHSERIVVREEDEVGRAGWGSGFTKGYPMEAYLAIGTRSSHDIQQNNELIYQCIGSKGRKRV